MRNKRKGKGLVKLSTESYCEYPRSWLPSSCNDRFSLHRAKSDPPLLLFQDAEHRLWNLCFVTISLLLRPELSGDVRETYLAGLGELLNRHSVFLFHGGNINIRKSCLLKLSPHPGFVGPIFIVQPEYVFRGRGWEITWYACDGGLDEGGPDG